MNARTDPALAAPGQISILPPELIAPSLTNTRKTHNAEKDKELADSVKAHGVLQAVLVRPLPKNRTDKAAAGKTHELVFGHRRHTAALTAALKSIPVVVRDLNDADVLKIQLVENGQREDIHPLEEAEGYERLLQCVKTPGDGKTTQTERYTVDDIAAMIGKSRRYVYNRLKLAELCPEGRKAYYAGTLDYSRALLVASLNHHDTQREAIKVFTQKNFQGEFLSYRTCADEARRRFMLELKTAPFDIKVVDYKDASGKFLPAGACVVCPKRSGNNPELFGEIAKSADVCTDVKCFGAKKDAHEARQTAVAKTELEALAAKGKAVLRGTAAEDAFNSQGYITKTYLDAEEGLWLDDLAKDKHGKNIKQILGKEAPIQHVISPRSNQIIQVVDKAKAMKLLKEKGFIKKPAAKKAAPAISKAKQAAADAQALKAEVDRIVLHKAWAALREKLAKGLAPEDWRLVAEKVLETAEGDDDFITQLYMPGLQGKPMWSVPYKKARDKMFAELAVEQIPRFLLDVCFSDFLGYGVGRHETAKIVAKMFLRHGVDEKKIRDQVNAEIKEKKAAEAVAKAAEPAKKPVAKKGGKK